MSKREEKKDKSSIDWELESINPEDYEYEVADKKEVPPVDESLRERILTEEEKRILLREEIKRANRPDYTYGEDENLTPNKKKNAKGVDLKVRRIGSLATTITSLVLTIISALLVILVLGSGDAAQIIFLGLFVVFPMEIIATLMAVIGFVANIVFMSTGRFSFLVLFNFLFSMALIAANLYIFFLGAEIVF